MNVEITQNSGSEIEIEVSIDELPKQLPFVIDKLSIVQTPIGPKLTGEAEAFIHQACSREIAPNVLGIMRKVVRITNMKLRESLI